MSGLVIFSQAAIQGVMMGSVYFLIASGLTMIFSVTRLLNFAHGDFMVVGMYSCLALFLALKLDPYVSIFLITPLMFGLGLLIYRFLIRPVLRAHILMVIQLTLGLVFILEGGLMLIFKADFKTVPTFLTASKLYLGPFIMGTPLLVAFLTSSFIAGFLFWVLKTTDFGRAIRAIAQSPDAAALMGINVGRIQMQVFGLGFLLLGIAGPMVIPLLTMMPFMGLHLTLFAFIILVLGGMGNFLGALLGGLILGVAEGLGYLYLGAGFAPAVPYSIFVLVLLFKPMGLLGGRR
jgi:branched-chain amino acid transport system permease protein